MSGRGGSLTFPVREADRPDSGQLSFLSREMSLPNAHS